MATPDIGLGKRGRVVGAVAAHGDELALGLLIADEAQLVLRRRLGEEIVDAGLRRDGGRGHRVVAGDHDGADAHAAEFGEAFADAAFDDVLEVDDAEGLPSLATASGVPPDAAMHARRSASIARAGLGHRAALTAAPDVARMSTGRPRRRLCGSTSPRCSTPLMRVCAVKGMKFGSSLGELAAADAVFLLGQHHDGAALRRFVGQRGELGGIGEVLLG